MNVSLIRNLRRVELHYTLYNTLSHYLMSISYYRDILFGFQLKNISSLIPFVTNVFIYPLQRLNDADSTVLAKVTAWDVFISLHQKKTSFGASYAVGHDLDIVDAAWEDLDLLIVDNFRYMAG
jgi:hypothetical protein